MIGITWDGDEALHGNVRASFLSGNDNVLTQQWAALEMENYMAVALGREEAFLAFLSNSDFVFAELNDAHRGSVLAEFETKGARDTIQRLRSYCESPPSAGMKSVEEQ